MVGELRLPSERTTYGSMRSFWMQLVPS
jgi:hypothetical protein